MGEQHLDTFAVAAGLLESFGVNECTGGIASVFVDAARDFAGGPNKSGDADARSRPPSTRRVISELWRYPCPVRLVRRRAAGCFVPSGR
jgi:hypothetical protein